MDKKDQSYNQIVRSTGIFGGSQLIIILIGIAKTKIIAVLLGATGVGLIGMYQSIIDMLRSITGLGLDNGAIKEVAESEASGDQNQLQRTISIVKQWFSSTAIIGLLCCLAFCLPISIWVFGDVHYAMPVAALSICIFLATLTTGRSVILQGLRRISFMAKAAILGSASGFLLTIPLYWIWGNDAIIPALIISAFVLFLSTDYFYRKNPIQSTKIQGKEAYNAGLPILRLGVFIVLAGIVSTVSMLIIRSYIIRKSGIDSAGLFQAVWTVTNVYLSLILKSMGTDFFPRLCAVSNNNAKLSQLINEQTYIILAISPFLITGVILFSHFILEILYSAEFATANNLLNLQIAGTFLKLLAWPAAFIMLAKGKGRLFLFSEVVYYLAYLIFCQLLYPHYGIDATGYAYIIAYAIYFPLVYIIAKKSAKLSWTQQNWLAAITGSIIISLILISNILYPTYYIVTGSILFIFSFIYGIYLLKKVFSMEDVKKWTKRN